MPYNTILHSPKRTKPVLDQADQHKQQPQAIDLDSLPDTGPSSITASSFGILVTRGLSSLTTDGWIIDEVINVMLGRLTSETFGVLSSFEISNRNGPSGPARGLLVGKNPKMVVLIPEHTNGNHWRLWRWTASVPSLELFDSMRSANASLQVDAVRVFSLLKQVYLRDGQTPSLHLDIEKIALIAPPCAQQDNAADCGIYTIAFAQALAAQSLPGISQSLIPQQPLDLNAKFARLRVGWYVVSNSPAALPHLSADEVNAAELRSLSVYCVRIFQSNEDLAKLKLSTFAINNIKAAHNYSSSILDRLAYGIHTAACHTLHLLHRKAMEAAIHIQVSAEAARTFQQRPKDAAAVFVFPPQDDPLTYTQQAAQSLRLIAIEV